MRLNEVKSITTDDGRDWLWFPKDGELFEVVEGFRTGDDFDYKLVEHDHVDEDSGWLNWNEVRDYLAAVGSQNSDS